MVSKTLQVLARTITGSILAAVGAILLTLAMPPYGIWAFALLGMVPTVLAQHRILPRKISSLAPAITIGGLVGLYIMKAFLQLANAPWYMELLPVIFGILVYITDMKSHAFHNRTHYRWLVLHGALGWVGVEMVRSLIPVIGTWGFIAYAYFKHPWMIQPVSIFGSFGLGLVTMILSFAIGQMALACYDRIAGVKAGDTPVDMRQARAWLAGASALYAAWLILSLALLRTPRQDPRIIRVAAVQPDYQSLWTDEERELGYQSFERYIETYDQLLDRITAQTLALKDDRLDVIVWPEGALNFDPQFSHTSILRDLAAETGAYLVLPYAVDYRNEVTILSPGGEFLGVYGKNHPVIFVNEQSTSRGTYPVYETSLGTIGTIICYDLDFTDTARKVARNGAQFIAVPSGDWDGIADKHYAHLVFRAVENRVAMVKADRTYDSAIIDPYGRLIQLVSNSQGQQASLVGDVAIVDMDPLQTWLGDWVGWLSLVGMFLFSVFSSRLGFKKQ